MEPPAAASFLLLPLSFKTGSGYVAQASLVSSCLSFPSVKIMGVRPYLTNFLQDPGLHSFARIPEPKLAYALF